MHSSDRIPTDPFCFSSAAHAAEAGFPLPAAPILFIKPRTALAGPGDLPVAKAAQDDQLDFETELALVIGKDCRDVSEDQALDYVLGWVQWKTRPPVHRCVVLIF